MILQSLVSLYDHLAAAGKPVPRYGKSAAKVAGKLLLNGHGELMGFMPLMEEETRGKKTALVQKVMVVPFQYKRSSGIKANFLCDGMSYFLGLADGSKEKDASKREKARKRALECFEASKKFHLAVLEGCSGDEAMGVKSFFTKWRPEKAADNPVVQESFADVAAGNLLMDVEGTLAHEVPEISAAWEKYFSADAGAERGQCLVTGAMDVPLETLHPSIKGVRGAQSSGASLVSFNSPAFESYGHDKDQGLNAPTGKVAAFKYGAALNYLLARGEKNTCLLGDTTVVFWSEHVGSKATKMIRKCIGNSRDTAVSDTVLVNCFKAVSTGRPYKVDGYVISPSEPFYILGLAPNAARLSVRFFLKNTFGEIVSNLYEHYKRMEIERAFKEDPKPISFWLMTKSSVNPHAKNDTVISLQMGAMLRSTLLGLPYPVSLYQNMLMRIFSERDEYDEKGSLQHHKIGYVRAAFIKAFLLKNYSWEGKLTMSLNENCREPAYVLGRMFSILERIQKQANPDIKATIKERYFNSACTSPAVTFPTLLKLAHAHLKKIGISHSEALDTLMDMLEMPDAGTPFPKRLSLEEQGAFVVGYYQETQASIKKAVAAKAEKDKQHEEEK